MPDYDDDGQREHHRRERSSRRSDRDRGDYDDNNRHHSSRSERSRRSNNRDRSRSSRSHSRSRSRSRSPEYHHRDNNSGSGGGGRGRSGSGDYQRSGGTTSGGGGGVSSSLLPSGVPTGIPQPIGGPSSFGMMGGGGGVVPLANPAVVAAATAPIIATNTNTMPTTNYSGSLAPMYAAAQSAQDKINRELFVGNTPPGTSEALLMQFLNGAMRRVNLCPPDGTPILNCRTNSKFAFVECASVDMANKALNLNGIPFLGASLRVSRPSKYAGPHVPSQTWQQLTGQPLPPGMIPVPENTGGNPEEKLHRELFVGNTTPEMTESMLKDFLGRALEQVGLTTMPGNPILACRVSGKFAFVELRSKEEAANALNLNNIPYLGAQLRVGRPSKYTGAETPHGNWEDILAKFMSGDLQLKNVGAQAAAPAAAAAAPAVAAAAPATQITTIVSLKQMLTAQDLEDDTEYNDILEDTRDECSSFGTLKNIVIPRTGPGATKIFLEYMSIEDAGRAIAGLAGRTFDGRKVEAVYFDPVKFANQDYSD